MVEWNAVSNTATCGRSGQVWKAARIPFTCAGVMQRRKRGQCIDLVDNLLVEQHGVGKLLGTLHHTVTR